MERTFCLIIDNISKITRIKSEAKTFGELKKDLVKENIDPSVYIVSSGNTREHIDDDYVFPEFYVNPINGKKTTDVPIMFTKKDKNIDSNRSSSSVIIDRKATIDKIRELYLVDDFKARYGKHVTNGKSDELYEFAKLHEFEDVCNAKSIDKPARQFKEDGCCGKCHAHKNAVGQASMGVNLPEPEDIAIEAGTQVDSIINEGVGKICSDFAGRACCAILLMLSDDDRKMVVSHLFARFCDKDDTVEKTTEDSDVEAPEVTKVADKKEEEPETYELSDEELIEMMLRK